MGLIAHYHSDQTNIMTDVVLLVFTGNYISDFGEQTHSSYRKLLKGIGNNKANITNVEYTRVLPTIKNGMVLLEEKGTFARNITS